MVDEEKVKSEIIETARGLIQQYGINKVTMQDIAKKAGKGKSTLYYYFKKKEEILDAVIEEEMNNFFLSYKKAVEAESEFHAKLKVYISSKIKSILYQREKYKFLMNNDVHYFDFNTYFKKMRFLYDDKEIELVKSIFKCGIEANILDKSKLEGDKGQLTAEVLVIAVRGIEMEVFVQEKFKNSKKITDLMVELLLNGIT